MSASEWKERRMRGQEVFKGKEDVFPSNKMLKLREY